MFDELSEKLDGFFRKIRGRGKLTEANIKDSLREVRRIMLASDVNFKVVKQFIADVEERALGTDVLKSITPGQMVVKIINDRLIDLLGGMRAPLDISGDPPVPLMVVGLQGSGKTTFCGKLAKRLLKKGKKPLMVAADIYRPAAAQQLKVLGDSLKVPVYIDSGSVQSIAKGALLEAHRIGADPVIFDTAGRLHIDEILMSEVQAVRDATTPRETLLVVDGLTGQDAVNVAEQFDAQIGISGVVLTRMDGDGRGGAALSMRAVTGKPIKFVGLGEKMDALEEFHPERIASRILGMGDIVSLVEKAQETIEAEQAEKMMKRMMKGQFNMNDLRNQLEQMQKMGGMSGIMGMMPGMAKAQKQMDAAGIDDTVIKRQIALIQSMTKRERANPQLMQASRKKRIAKGAGMEVSDLNKLLKMQRQMGDMMKKMGKMGKKGLMRQGLGALMGKGGNAQAGMGGGLPQGMGANALQPGFGTKPGAGLPTDLSGMGKKK